MKNYFALFNVSNDALIGIIAGSTDKELNLSLSQAIRDETSVENTMIPNITLANKKIGSSQYITVTDYDSEVVGDFRIEPTWVYGEQ